MTLLSNFNQDISKWGQTNKRELKLQVLQQTTKYSGLGEKGLNVSVKKYMGEASKISFTFPYYMVFVHKGAGRGYGGNKSGLFTTANGSKGKTNSDSMGKMGTGRRTAKPWFNPVLEKNFPELADLVANYHGGDLLLNLQKILIK